MKCEIYLFIFGLISISTIITSAITTCFVLKKEYDRTVKMDITLNQMLTLENRLSKFLQENQLKKSANINEIAKVLKVHMGGEDNKLLTQAHLSDPDEFGNRKVTFKKGLPSEKRLFNFAHECAHLINEDPAPYTRPEGHKKAFVEQLADYTAAAMLMPREEVYEYLEQNSYRELSDKKRVAIIHSLCRKYKVNDIIALRRVKEVYIMKQ